MVHKNTAQKYYLRKFIEMKLCQMQLLKGRKVTLSENLKRKEEEGKQNLIEKK